MEEPRRLYDGWIAPAFGICLVLLFLCPAGYSPIEVKTYIASLPWPAAYRSLVLGAFETAMALVMVATVILGIIVVGGWLDRNMPKSDNPFDDGPDW